MKFDDPKAGNSLKDRRLRGELKECVPITARKKRFPLKKGKSTVIVERKQFLLIFGHAITVHKYQVNTLTYMLGDLNWEELSTSYISGSILHLKFPCQKSG